MEDYQTLAKKYDNFTTPVFRFWVNGKNPLAGQSFQVEDVTVSLSLDQAGSVQFTIINAFQLNTRRFVDAAKDAFHLGSIIKVDFGYGSNLKCLFLGYISEIGLDYGNMPVISITAFDLIRLLMETERNKRVYTISSYSQTLKELLDQYKEFYEKIEIEQANAGSKEEQLVQIGSDYQFIKGVLCSKAGKEFLVEAGTVYFRTPDKEKKVAVSLKWGEGLETFQERKKQCNQLIRVYGRAENRKEQISAEVKARETDSSDRIFVLKELERNNLIGEEKVRKEAERLAMKQTKQSNRGSGSCVGLPELLPGRILELGNLDQTTPKTCYITGVRHSIGSSGYTTQFDVEIR